MSLNLSRYANSAGYASLYLQRFKFVMIYLDWYLIAIDGCIR